jgi:AcrR family transcriptional regulator
MGRGAISTLREGRKQATRRRVLDAARQLFEEVGFEAATIRAIARRAGVSIGAVFTGFSSKAHVLSEVMQERLVQLYADLERLAPHLRGSTADRCRSIFAASYASEADRVRLVLAYIAAGYDWRADPALPRPGSNLKLRGLVRDCLASGVERGDVRPDADLDLACDLLVGVHLWNFHLAAAGASTTDGLINLCDRQIGLIFEGLAPKS